MEIIVDGYNINYKITGEGSRTAVMLQGWGTGLDMYDSVGWALPGYRFVQFDLPGFGDSDEPREPWNVEAYAEFFMKFMEALDIREAALIAHSYGGRIVIKLAELVKKGKTLPFTITKLVLIDSAGIMPERSPAQQRKVRRYKMMRNFLMSKPVHAMFPEVIDYWMSQQGSDDYRNSSPMMKKCMVMAVNEDQREWLPEIKQETLLIWGDLDDATPIGDAKIMEERIPDCALIVLDGTGHYSFLEKPQQFRGIIGAFLGASGGDAGSDTAAGGGEQ